MFGRQKHKNNASGSTSLIEGDNSFPVGPRVFAGITLGMLLFVGAGGWAATAQLTGAIIAPGMVKVDQNLKSIQHRDGGIISEIAVREGDFVTKGQVMLRLDDAETRAELSIVRTQLVELMAKQARLMAERDNRDSIEFSPELTSRVKDFPHVFFGENRMFDGNRQNRKSQKEQLTLGIDQLGEEIKGLQSQRDAKIDEIALVTTEHGKIKGLTDKRLIETSRKYIIDREMAKLLGERGEVEANIARAKARMGEIRLQILAIDETARTEAQRELSSIEPKLSELRERRVAIEDRLARADIRAPLSGTVNELSVHTIGGVITPAEKLVTLVPEDAALKIEAKLAPTDIDQVFVGQPAKLRFSAFNSAQHLNSLAVLPMSPPQPAAIPRLARYSTWRTWLCRQTNLKSLEEVRSCQACQ
jgi:HlyD family type I secretion membrane fusion protein